jgi:hypothetical protein
MRIPVFARGSNPRVDRPNQRKNVKYGEEEVRAGRADWINPQDHSQGILCRAFLYSGQTLKPADREQVSQLSRRSLGSTEIPGVSFDDPMKDMAIRLDRVCLLVRAEAFARYGDLRLSELQAAHA